MEDRNDKDRCQATDHLAFLLITIPREGWEREYKELVRREVERLDLVAEEVRDE